jgi:hypothetical protein
LAIWIDAAIANPVRDDPWKALVFRASLFHQFFCLLFGLMWVTSPVRTPGALNFGRDHHQQ